ncbi:lysozyme inhibitor LprI family protein [Methylococcus capsulatus]|uniref:lysozyme inhibitor LprI family protein n=1 Tax=Methylococcus capsulatus TaxID=414 RepID=UPI0002D59969|nr:lysozyme inhibitor LprI family protein [Methylococcus capsulatus]QXP86630.1 DUF1311 domain-containing protein [Methylococcus capsulatus]QXP92043.1 DUF1311 domain-containing protein [Methylococcus capsulatus]QXP93692.1 DUF1311 domain-containing protein [Methylococcus capsulatus]UQN11593.1 lysozyme inhibitor LprI family protein [Methylococcus capsulatus]
MKTLFFCAAAVATTAAVHADPRPSFDCTKAQGSIERAICSDENLAARDRSLAERFARLEKDLSPESFATVRNAQRDWVSWVRAWCGGKKSAEDASLPSGVADCLNTEYGEREGVLALPSRTSGTLKLEGRLIFRNRKVASTAEVEDDGYPWLTGTPADKAQAFNRHIEKTLAIASRLSRFTPGDLKAMGEGVEHLARTFEVHHFDGHLISLEVIHTNAGPTGHTWMSEYALNWDLDRGRPLKLDDVFRVDRKFWETVVAQARKYLKENSDTADVDGWLDSVSTEVKDEANWLFDDRGVVVLLGHGSRSAAGTAAEVPVGYAELRPFLKTDRPSWAGTTGE